MVATGSTKTASLPWDEKVYEQLKAENDKELEELQKEEDEAVEKAGDTEVTAARGKRAEFYARVGDKVHGFDSCLKASCLITPMLTPNVGQGDSGIRGPSGQDRHTRNEDRSCPRHYPSWSLFRRQVVGQEAGGTG